VHCAIALRKQCDIFIASATDDASDEQLRLLLDGASEHAIIVVHGATNLVYSCGRSDVRLPLRIWRKWMRHG